jgi:hypothetical protein
MENPRFPVIFCTHWYLRIAAHSVYTECGKGGTAYERPEKVIALLDSVPDYKMDDVLAYVQGITADVEDDDTFCGQM